MFRKFIEFNSINGDVIVVKIKSIFKINEIFFKWRGEFEEIIVGGYKIKSTVILGNDFLI